MSPPATRGRRVKPPKEIFLSHSHRDHLFVKRLSKTLREHGIASWYSERHLVGAQQWHREIGKALRRCDWLLVILTPDSVESRWVERELVYALDHERYDNRIVPLVLKTCDYEKLSFVFSAIQRIDARRNYANACRELLRIWGIAYQP